MHDPSNDRVGTVRIHSSAETIVVRQWCGFLPQHSTNTVKSHTHTYYGVHPRAYITDSCIGNWIRAWIRERVCDQHEDSNSPLSVMIYCSPQDALSHTHVVSN